VDFATNYIVRALLGKYLLYWSKSALLRTNELCGIAFVARAAVAKVGSLSMHPFFGKVV